MLTPIDIENKEFEKAFRGYDIDEVEEFLQVIVNDYEKLYRENASLKEKNAMLQEAIGNYRGMEETMQNAIIAAQRTAEDIKRNAYHRAENITREAQTRANESIANADKTIQELENSYLALQGEVDTFRARMRSILETNLKLLDEMPRIEIKTIERVKVDPVTIDPVEHTAPLPDVNKAADNDFADTMPVPELAQKKAEPKSAWRDSVESERVPLSEKIPVAQSTRGTNINPVIDQLMKERSKVSEPAVVDEAPAEESTDDFGVTKQTFDASIFAAGDEPGEKEVVVKFKKDKNNDSGYFDVFTDDSL